MLCRLKARGEKECVCVCEREGEKRQRKREGEREEVTTKHLPKVHGFSQERYQRVRGAS